MEIKVESGQQWSVCTLTTATAGLTRLLHPPVIHINCRDWLEVTEAKHTFKKLALPVVKSSLTKSSTRKQMATHPRERAVFYFMVWFPWSRLPCVIKPLEVKISSSL